MLEAFRIRDITNQFLTDMTEEKKTIHNLIILDESGSMSSIYEQALSGANETINAIRVSAKENPNLDQRLTFVTFDSGYNRPDVRFIIDDMPIDEVKDLTKDDYRPSGCTPLYDAMGLSITRQVGKVKDGENAIVTIITDGYENSSHEFSGTAVKKLVEGLREKGWIFTYIGANQNSVEVSRELGIRHAMDFQQDADGTAMMFRKMRSSHMSMFKAMASYQCIDDDFDVFRDKSVGTRVTPENIDTLAPGEVFVFGSNLAGQHGAGAAKTAVEKFGAVMGQGVGMQGQSYAIPTMFRHAREMRPYVEEFIKYAEMHPELKFYVTKLGCGIAGFRPREVAPLFAGVLALDNVYLPREFWDIILYRYKR